MGIRRIALAAIVLALAGSAPTPTFGDLVTYTVDPYAATFATGSFALLGAPTPMDINLTPGVPQTVLLDLGHLFMSTTTAQTYTGTATSDLTVDGVTQSVSDAFSFTTGGPISLSFSGGAPVVFNLGAFQVTVTPIASDTVRQATFLETPVTTAVPEPSSALAVGFGALAGLGVWARKRRAAK